MIPTLFVTSVLIFSIVVLPPGDYFDTLVSESLASGEKADLTRIEFLRKEYGFDKSPVERYVLWVSNLLRGDLGYSFEYQLPVNDLVGDRMVLTIIVSGFTILFTWIIAFPIGIYSATHQYSWGGLRSDIPRSARVGDPAFPAGARDRLFRQCVVWRIDWRADGRPVSQSADELAEILVDHAASVDTGHRHRHGRHGKDDPGGARQSARRTAEAVLHHGARQGFATGARLDEISIPPVA